MSTGYLSIMWFHHQFLSSVSEGFSYIIFTSLIITISILLLLVYSEWNSFLKPFLECLLFLYRNVTDLCVLIFHLVDFCWMYYQLWEFSCGLLRIFYVQIYTIPNKSTFPSSFLGYFCITSLCHAIVSTKIVGIMLSRCADSGHPFLYTRIFPSVFHFARCRVFVYCLYFADTCPLCP